MKAAKSVSPSNPETNVRVLKTGTCPSLSGRSKLKFEIGVAGSSDIHFRISANSAAGYFNNDWLALNDILEVLDKVPNGKPITSYSLSPLLRGKSANTPAFLFAALEQEGLVAPSKDKPRCYERLDPKEFMSSIKALMALDGKPEGKLQSAKEKPTKATPRQAAMPGKKTPSKPSGKKKA